ncbi:Zn-dependent exopeptidase [Xylariaceae sp. FL0016]|nr:Zn-dependent exopeptidase [Xylariaceae sp. FL0016]
MAQEALVESIVLEDLMECAQSLEDIAYATPNRNRVHGSEGHLNSVAYFVRELEALGDYYAVEKQAFTTEVTMASSSALSVNGEAVEAGPFSFSNNGTWSDAPLVPVADLGCGADDYPAALAGAVALIARGDCTFAAKAELAAAAGAVGVIIYNNADVGLAAGTLGGANDLVAVGGISRADGLRLVAAYGGNGTAAPALRSSGAFWSYTVNATSYNVVASSRGGDADNVLMLGAHSDSVEAGPGINDNGSGSCGLLAIAKKLAAWRTTNQVRFAWWTAEEEGLLGAEHYTEITPAAEMEKIRLYLNFDMRISGSFLGGVGDQPTRYEAYLDAIVASPNYVLGIYDGDGSAFNLTGPTGSDKIEAFFESYCMSSQLLIYLSPCFWRYKAQGLPFVPTEFSGRSDYGPFLDHGVPCGGLETGADGIKTEEEVALFGGVAGAWYDPNYHSAADNVTNLATDAFEIVSKAIAHGVATYGASWGDFPTRNATGVARRGLGPRRYGLSGKGSRFSKRSY